MPNYAESKTKSVADASYTPNSTQQGGTAEDGHIHLTDWTVCVAAIGKK